MCGGCLGDRFGGAAYHSCGKGPSEGCGEIWHVGVLGFRLADQLAKGCARVCPDRAETISYDRQEPPISGLACHCVMFLLCEGCNVQRLAWSDVVGKSMSAGLSRLLDPGAFCSRSGVYP